jgi:group I intron endonuclease
MDTIPRTSGIYQITCTPTGKIYIGSAINLHRRYKNHLTELRGNRHKNAYLQRAWNKYGELAFEYSVIELVLESFLLEREQYWMDKLGACTRKRGFNILPQAGSRIGSITPEDVRKKISDRMRGMPGRKWSEETRARLSPIRRERSVRLRIARDAREAERRAARAARPPQKRDPEAVRKTAQANTGKKRTEETRRKMSEALRRNTNGGKRYILIDPDGAEHKVINLAEWCRVHGFRYNGFRLVLSGDRKSYMGWRCYYDVPY